ncbi:melanoma-associated antigen B10-like [Hipposideros larvatus]
MPRGQKSKLRAREKRRQAREEPKDPAGAQATRPEEKESPSSPSSDLENVPQSSPVTEIPSHPPVPGGVHSTTIAAAASNASFNEGANNQVAERSDAAQAQATTEEWPKGPLEKKVILLVYYLLYKYQMKEPISKTDMLRNVIQVYRNRFLEILKRASEHLEMVFGLDMKEMDPHRHIYILVNKLNFSYDAMPSDDRGVPKTGLLMTILGVIFTKGNCATEEQVWQMLNVIGLHKGRHHFFFGEPKKLITKTFVKEKYLEYRQVPGSDPPRYEFLWGPRAYVETTKMKVLEFVAKIHDTVPTAFPSCYEEAVRDEEERARARAAARARIAATASARAKAMASARSKAIASSSSHNK